jgi:endonuclease VIII
VPEGDSYVRAAERLRPVLVGETIEAVDGSPAVRRWAARLTGRRITGIRTYGKHLLIDVEGDLTIRTWLGMPGRWLIQRRGATGRRTSGAARLVISTGDHTVVCLSAPTIEVERRRVIDRALERLGPDILAATFDWDEYRRRAALVDPGSPVVDLLLDQRVVAGIGNEFTCEILFLERIHPSRPVGTLDAGTTDGLARRARRIMPPNARRAARTTTGSTVPGRESWVFRRTGAPCRRCRTEIDQGWVGRRAPRITYWCPACQPATPEDRADRTWHHEPSSGRLPPSDREV